MNELEIAKQLNENQENIILIYAFNSVGKTRLSVAYKDYTKSENDGNHAGVYYNAFSEDLFVWENDEDHDNANITFKVNYSNLSQFHSLLDEKSIEEKLALYNTKYKFEFTLDKNPERGIESITFFKDENKNNPIKISRGEERIFVWCFFLALFEVETWTEAHGAHFFIDDPVSSLDEHNIFLTAESIFGLIEENYLKKRIIITTHHIGLFSILFDKLKKGEKSGRYDKLTKPFILGKDDEKMVLNNVNNDVFLFHLHLIKTLDTAIKNELYAYHFVLLRQLVENISSFLGVGRMNYTLEQIGIEKAEEVASVINSLSHKNVYRLQFNKMAEAEEEVFRDVFQKVQAKYNFKF